MPSQSFICRGGGGGFWEAFRFGDFGWLGFVHCVLKACLVFGGDGELLLCRWVCRGLGVLALSA